MIRVEYWLSCDGCGTGLYSSERTKRDTVASARANGYTAKMDGSALCPRCSRAAKDAATRERYANRALTHESEVESSGIVRGEIDP